MPSRIRTLAGQSARLLYRRLPLPLPVKWRMKSFLYRHLGMFLKNSANYQQWLIQTAATRPATVQAPGPAAVPPPPSPPPMLEIGPEGVEGLAASLAYTTPEGAAGFGDRPGLQPDRLYGPLSGLAFTVTRPRPATS